MSSSPLAAQAQLGSPRRVPRLPRVENCKVDAARARLRERILALVVVLAACGGAPSPTETTPTRDGAEVRDVVVLDEIDAASAERVLGAPTSKSSEVWGVDGVTYTTWKWSGVELVTSPDGAAHSVTCAAPCALRTRLGVGVGSGVEEVEKAYGAQIDRGASRPDHVVVGEVHGGIFFDLKGDEVVRVFVGAAAE